MNLQSIRALVFIAIAATMGGCAMAPVSTAVTYPATTETTVALSPLEDSTAMIPPVSVQPTTTDEPTDPDPERDAQIECLAKNIYFEARGESSAGRIAVGQVTINRTRNGNFPNTICGVVKQRHQFSWYWDGVVDQIKQTEVYDDIYVLATKLYNQYYLVSDIPDIVNGATYFHTSSIHPKWKNMRVVARIDRHVFLRLREN